LDVPAYALKTLLNPKMNGDITAFMLKAGGVRAGAEMAELMSMAVND